MQAATAAEGAGKLIAGLNPEQAEAVRSTEGAVMILAGPGSGKTRVICHRVAWLILTGLARPREILAVTFTNKAAGEMRERLATLLGGAAPRVAMSTFHAFCARLLREDGATVEVPDNYVIYDRDDQLRTVRRVIKERGLSMLTDSPRGLLARISTWKSAMKTPASVTTATGNYLERKLAEGYREYERLLREAGALDFDDLLLRATRLLTTNDEVRDQHAERYRYILVDEYQDTNECQYTIMRELASRHGNVCVVGDPDQAIYGWRGADIRNIEQFAADFPQLRTVRLERNYRSTRAIVDAASAVIEAANKRPAKQMWTDREAGREVEIVETADDLAEAEAIAALARTRPAGARQLAVLYRMNAQSRTIEDALRHAVIPYHIVGNIRFYERKEIKDTLAYLKVVTNRRDEVSIRRIINVPSRRIGERTVEKILALPARAGAPAGGPLLNRTEPGPDDSSMWAKLGRAAGGEGEFAPAVRRRLGAFEKLIDALVERCAAEDVGDAVMRVIVESGYLPMLQEEKSEEATERIANLMELVSAAREYEDETERPSLSEFIDRQSLLSEADEGNGPDDAKVWLMTLHASKGLEFPAVAMVGMEDELLPHSRSKDDPVELAEERRLCYVGMTRAEDELTLTRARRRRRHGRYEDTAPSRFLYDIREPEQREESDCI